MRVREVSVQTSSGTEAGRQAPKPLRASLSSARCDKIPAAGGSLSGFQLVKSGVSTFLTGPISIGVSQFNPLFPPFMPLCSLLFCIVRLVPGLAILSRSNTGACDSDGSQGSLYLGLWTNSAVQ